MKKRVLAILILAVAASGAFVGCAENNIDAESEKSPVNSTVTESKVEEQSDKIDEEKLYDELFNIDNKISIKININNDELQKIQNDYDKYSKKNSKSPIYRCADKITVTVGDKAYEVKDVGIRMKGNTSRDDFYDSSRGIYKLSHFKLSFCETFDNENYYGEDMLSWSDNEREERKNRTFASLEKLDMKWNRNYDKTYCREYYAYSIFRSEGVLAPRLNMAELTIGDEYLGVYTIYEPVDKIFIRRNLPEQDWDGDLYKAMWTNNPADYTKSVTYGVEDEDSKKFYNYDLKTNKKTSNHESLCKLINVLNTSNVTKEEVSSVIDIDNFMSFAAVSYFTGNPDDMRNNYNNHYVYFRKSNGKAIFIPYDYDRTLGITCGWNPTGDGMTGISPFSERAEGAGEPQKNPIYRYTIFSDGYFYEEYKSELKKVADGGYLNIDSFEKVFNKVMANYSESTKPEKSFDNADLSKFRFDIENDEDNITVKRYFEEILSIYKSSVNH